MRVLEPRSFSIEWKKTSGLNRRTSFAALLVAICALGVAVVWSSELRAQERRSAQQKFEAPGASSGGEVATPTNMVVAPNEEYRLGAGDVIEVRVEDAPELTKKARINPKGTFPMPYLQVVTAKGKTTEELAMQIADGLRGRYLKDPKVNVTVTQINSHSFYIQGAVRRPGEYQIEGHPTLMKLISVAGGLGENRGSTAFIIRELRAESGAAATPEVKAEAKTESATSSAQGPAPVAAEAEENAKYELLKANISNLYKGRFDQNVQLEVGDIVNIPPSDVFFVAGEVREPGSYPLKDGTTLRQAISLAQGPTFKAAANRGIIYREDPNGQRQEIKVDIAAVMSGKKEDVVLSANDIIIVPNSAWKSTALPILNSLGTGASYGVGNVILRR